MRAVLGLGDRAGCVEAGGVWGGECVRVCHKIRENGIFHGLFFAVFLLYTHLVRVYGTGQRR